MRWDCISYGINQIIHDNMVILYHELQYDVNNWYRDQIMLLCVVHATEGLMLGLNSLKTNTSCKYTVPRYMYFVNTK